MKREVRSTKSEAKSKAFIKRVGLFFLPLLLLGATVNSAAPTYNKTILGTSSNYKKVLLLFDLPSLSGGTCTAATLHFHVSNYLETGETMTVTARSSNANVSWDESTVYTTLNGYATSANLGTCTVSPGDGGSNKTIDVSGDAGKGVIQAYAGGTKTTLVLTDDYSGGTANSAATQITLGNGSYPELDVSDRTSGADAPYLEITYTPGAGGGTKKVTSASACVLMR